jgi:hypothetical protein
MPSVLIQLKPASEWSSTTQSRRPDDQRRGFRALQNSYAANELKENVILREHTRSISRGGVSS